MRVYPDMLRKCKQFRRAPLYLHIASGSRRLPHFENQVITYI